MGYDPGTAAGLMAGAFTESTIIGTAGNAISRLDLSADEKERLLNNIPVAYAVSYLVGTGFVVWFLSSLAPRLLGIDLKAEVRKLAEGGAGMKTETRTRSAYREWDVRAFRIKEALAGRTVADVEGSFAPARVFVQRIRRDVGIARRPAGGDPALGGLRGRRRATARPPRSGLPFRRGGGGPGAARLSHGRPRRGRHEAGRSRTAPWPRSRASTAEESSC